MIVATQQELDQALIDGEKEVIIDSPRDAWVRVADTDSSHVVAVGSSRVVAGDSSHVEARDSSHVEASKYVAIHLHSKRATTSGGVVIDVADIDTNKVSDFIDYHGVTVKDGVATVYKAVDDDLKSGYGFAYPVGETVEAHDWDAAQSFGGGLHFGNRPTVARAYFEDATRFLECEVPIEGLIALGDKVKSRTAHVVREVDIYGEAV